MIIDEKILKEELSELQAEFDKSSKQIKEVEKNLLQMRNNLNAVYGALQQTQKLLSKVNENKEESNEKV
jgi:uncharacterized protein YoxC